MKSQAAFHTAQKLNFPLLSDPDASVATKYAALMPDGRYTARKTFVIDPAGILVHIDDKVDVAQHGSVLTAWIRAHQ